MQSVSEQFFNTGKTTGKSSTSLKEPSSIIMFSGGVDSVSVLKRLLEETEDKIYAHHIHIKNQEGINNFKRYKAEAKVLRKLVPYMKRVFRDFHYSESTIDVRQVANLLPAYYNEKEIELVKLSYTPDQSYYCFIGGLLAKDTHSFNVHIGTCKEDYDASSRYSLSEIYQERQGNMDKIIEGASYPLKVKIQRLHDEQTKKQNIEYLGKELMDMVWYCRHSKILSCNTNLGIYAPAIDPETGQIYKCRSCRVVSDALIEIEEEQEEKRYA